MHRVVAAWRFGEESIDHIPKALLPGVWRAEMKGKREWRNFRSWLLVAESAALPWR
jgi:hypothetical protein